MFVEVPGLKSRVTNRFAPGIRKTLSALDPASRRLRDMLRLVQFHARHAGVVLPVHHKAKDCLAAAFVFVELVKPG